MSFQIQYKPMFSVEVARRKLPLIGDGRVRPAHVFRMEPTRECRQLLDLYGLIFRAREDGFEVFFKSHPLLAEDARILHKISGRIGFRFLVFPFNGTILDAYFRANHAAAKNLYFHNLNAGQIMNNGSELSKLVIDYAGNNPAIQATRIEFVTIRPPLFTVATSKDNGGNYPYDMIVVKDAGQGGIPDKTIELDKNDNPPTIYTEINLEGYPSGRYDLNKENGDLISRIYLDQNPAGPKSLGMLDIYWEGEQKSTIVNNNEDFRKYYLLYDEKF